MYMDTLSFVFSFFFLTYNFIYLFMAVLGLDCFEAFSLVVASRGYSLILVLGLLISVVSLIVQHGL